jgi:hypothetical protein
VITSSHNHIQRDKSGAKLAHKGTIMLFMGTYIAQVETHFLGLSSPILTEAIRKKLRKPTLCLLFVGLEMTLVLLPRLTGSAAAEYETR